jgi:2-amino-4-hydroxy-6-hydroxymethyldihydropteridine diphosphokinase
MRPVVAYIGLGSNLAHPRRRIARALQAIERIARVRVLRVSPNYRSAPLGAAGPQPDYVNAVAAVSTTLPPRSLLGRLHAIERHAGRRRAPGVRNEPRTLDLDLLLYGRLARHARGLTIPHARMHERAFVLKPLLDIAPDAIIPRRGHVKRLLRPLAHQRLARTRSHAIH